MSFLETVAKAKAYLREHERVSLQGLRREFDLDETAVDELIEELVDVQQVAAREGKVLSWIGAVPPPDRNLPIGARDAGDPRSLV